MKKNLIYFVGIIFLLVSCYPEGPEYYEELDLVFTNYSESYDFSGKSTYAMPDKIVKVTGNLLDGKEPEYVKEPYNTQMLKVIQDNMSALGWTKVDDPDNADLALLPAVWSNTTVYYWYDYWCWWYYYYCGWGYYGGYYATSVTTGSLYMTLIAGGDDYIDPSDVWTGILNGLVTGSYDASRVTDGINQAFEQSPYLKVN